MFKKFNFMYSNVFVLMAAKVAYKHFYYEFKIRGTNKRMSA